MKPKRKKIVREILEAKLEKYQRRMQAISEEAYKIRQQLEHLDSLPKQIPLTKEAREKLEKETADALHKDGAESIPGEGRTDQDAGQSELSDNPTSDPVLEKQSAELPSNQ